MLVLTRRLNQSIKIGDDIEITVIEVRGDQVRLSAQLGRLHFFDPETELPIAG